MRVPAEDEGHDPIRTETGVEPVRCMPAVLSFLRREEWGMEFMLEHGVFCQGPTQGADSINNACCCCLWGTLRKVPTGAL